MTFDPITFTLGIITGLILGGVLFKIIPMLVRAYFSLMTSPGRAEMRQTRAVRQGHPPQEDFREYWVNLGRSDREKGLPPSALTTDWIRAYYDEGYERRKRAA